MPGPSIHLRPATELAERVLLPGDPHRALHVAQALLERPLMFNHHRGLWGYTGTARDGRPLTVQATGMGGPSAAIVVEELMDLGARILLRIGTCGALREGFELGAIVPVRAAVAADGASTALGACGMVEADHAVVGALEEAATREAAVAVSTDLFYDPRTTAAEEWTAAGASLVEMEAAAILQAAARRGARAGALLAVTDLLTGADRRRAAHEAVEQMGLALGETAWTALERLG